MPISEPLAQFVATELGVSAAQLSASTRLFHDLGVDGEDGREFMEAYGRRFDVDLSGFDHSRHFGEEAAANPIVWLWWFLTRTWPKVTPITLGELEQSLQIGRWSPSEKSAV